jgi:hypothetical protein
MRDVTKQNRTESDRDDAELRRRLHIETGRAARNLATSSIDNSMVRLPRKPSMPKLPWDTTDA